MLKTASETGNLKPGTALHVFSHDARLNAELIDRYNRESAAIVRRVKKPDKHGDGQGVALVVVAWAWFDLFSKRRLLLEDWENGCLRGKRPKLPPSSDAYAA